MWSDIRHYLHHVISIYVILGGLITYFYFKNCKYIVYHMYFCGFIILHWITNNNKCCLSEYDYNDDDAYTFHVLEKFGINIKPGDPLRNIIPYLTILIPMYISYKLWGYCKDVSK